MFINWQKIYKLIEAELGIEYLKEYEVEIWGKDKITIPFARKIVVRNKNSRNGVQYILVRLKPISTNNCQIILSKNCKIIVKKELILKKRR